MLSSPRAVAIALLLVLVGAHPASAIFFPGVQRQSAEQLDIQEEEGGYWATLWDEFEEAFWTPVGGLAANLDYHYGTQDFSSTLTGLAPFDSRSELNTYSIRPEIVWTNWLSTYAIAALHRGTNTSDDVNLDLDGWGAGVGVTAAVGLPPYTVKSREVTFDPLFIVPDFNWTHNEFADIENTVNVYNVTTRIGAGMRTDQFNWGLYAGPMYQYSTKDLMIPFAGTIFTVDTEPRNPWSGVVGAYFGVIYSDEDPKDVDRPTFLLTVEGGVGNRQGVLVSLRYEYDFFK